MEYFNNILCVRADWLMDNKIVSKPNYDRLSACQQINVVRRGCRATPALVSYESIPERFKPAIIRALGGRKPHEVAKVSQVLKFIEHSALISDYFDEYRLSDGRGLSPETRREYYANAIVLDGIGRMLADKNSYRRSRGGRVVHNWDDIAQGVQDLDRKAYPHALPSVGRRLKDRYSRYVKEGLESLIHKNFLNAHASKTNETESNDTLLMLASDGRNLDNAQVAYYYNMMAEAMDWQPITPGTVANFRKENEHIIYARRRGATEFRNRKAMQVKRSAPTFPLYYWTMDGWNVELAYREGSTFHHRVSIVVVLDPCCKYPVGYAIGEVENPEVIKAALRNAMKHTESLFGQMYRTNQLQSDNYAIKKMTPTYEGIGDKVTPTAIRNAKAKIIEPWFNYFNKKYCQPAENWTGFGFGARKENQPNREYLNKGKHRFPDFDGVCRQLASFIEAERAEKQAAYLELFGLMPAEHKIPLSYESYLMLFGATTGHRNLLQGSGLKITIGGQKRDYDCFDHNFRKYASTRWEVRFDPEDLSRVLAVNDDESLRFVLEEKYVQPMALIERKPGDYEQLQRIREFNEQDEYNIATVISGAQERTQILIEQNRARLEESTLQKLLLTDSNGQHKDNLSESRRRKKPKSAELSPVFEVTEENYLDLY